MKKTNNLMEYAMVLYVKYYNVWSPHELFSVRPNISLKEN